jgi:Raf kinase inhibitor-like YbhB/YbcL family protein
MQDTRILLAAGLLAGLLAGPANAMTITSADVVAGAPIPAPHIYPRCGGKNVSPDLSWSPPPAGTKSLVLTMIDTDVAPSGWSHWIVVDLPPSTRGLLRGLSSLPAHARAIPSNFGDPGYDGPCPPPGSGTHHYEFAIWAMPDPTTVIAPDARALEVRDALARSALDHASLSGTVTR